MRPLIALVTARAARGLDEDMPPLEAALRAAGAQTHTPAWDEDVDWGSFTAVVLRSAWDYAERIGEFLTWVDQVAAVTLLLNPPQVVRWNTDKHYLAELAHGGVAIVPTQFIEPGASTAAALQRFVVEHSSAELVVKPAVGAGARDAQRHSRKNLAAAVAHAERLLEGQRSVMVQPYLAGVDQHGETALVYFNGDFSHSVRKGPLLLAGAKPTEGLFAPERITPRAPGRDERQVAEAALAALPFKTPLLYARIDLMRGADHAPCVSELELAEPSLFFAHEAGSAERFARALLMRVRN